MMNMLDNVIVVSPGGVIFKSYYIADETRYDVYRSIYKVVIT